MPLDLAAQRLRNQRILGEVLARPSEVVGWLGAMQAQDYLGALWAVGLRGGRLTERDVEQALARREIVRTWPMRGTLHFVAAADVGWMRELLAPRVIGRSSARERQLKLDDSVFARGRELFTQALHGDRQLTRAAMYQVLEADGIATAGQRGLHIIGRLALEGLLCLAAREGKQPTYALLDEWAPGAPRLDRQAALAELTRRYFTSHGPATLQDLMWWSGLTTREAQLGLDLAAEHLKQETIDERRYWRSASSPPSAEPAAGLFLLPPFDEYLLGYRDRDAVLNPAHRQQVQSGNNGMFKPIVVSNGQVVGTWQRLLKRDRAIVTLQPFTALSAAQRDAFAAEAHRYGQFLGLPVTLA